MRVIEFHVKHTTIFALSSGPGVGGVAVIRISGPGAQQALRAITKGAMPRPRFAALRTLIDPNTAEMLDQALVLLFKAPASFTGEDVVELHVHGGRAVVDGIMAALESIDGLVVAEPGEFSRRAFEAGKLDLTEIEGLGDLIQAQTKAQKIQALRQMDGDLSKLYEGWRHALIRHLAHLEADIDFPDEDLPDGVAGKVAPQIDALKSEIEVHLEDGARGEKLREGFRIVILGEPNAGKSTLLNYLAAADVAIVTEEAGTTRDVLEVQLDLGGYPVRVMDTAGIRDGDVGLVEAEGIKRAKQQASEADLRLVLIPQQEWPAIPESLSEMVPESFVVVSKCDDGSLSLTGDEMVQGVSGALGIWPISVHSGFGVTSLIEALADHVADLMGLCEAPALTRSRHRVSLMETVSALERFAEHSKCDAVLAAEDVRLAARSLGRITGGVDVEDLLDVIFSDFCIGK